METTSTTVSSFEAVEALTAIAIPMPLLLAALACSSTDDARPHLNGVHLHTVSGSVHIVGTDGVRMFIGRHKPTIDLPGWLTDGITVPNEYLKERLSLISKISGDAPYASIAFGKNAPRVELSDFGGQNVFRLAPVGSPFPDYLKLVGSVVGAFSPETLGDFQPVGFSATYLKSVGDISKVLGAKFVSVYGQSQQEPSVFTFEGAPGAVLYLVPASREGFASTPPAETMAILAPAIKGTVAALRAHQTRQEQEAKKETDPGKKAAALARADSFKARIAAVLKSLPTALPAPDKKPEPEKAAATPEKKGDAEKPAADTTIVVGGENIAIASVNAAIETLTPAPANDKPAKAAKPAKVKIKAGTVKRPKLPKPGAAKANRNGIKLVKKASANGAAKHN